VFLAAAAVTVATATPKGPGGAPPKGGAAVSVGFTLRDLRQGDPYPAEARGAFIEAVIDGSPAGQKGLQRGDLIVSVGGQPVSSAAEAQRAIEATSGPLRLIIARGNSMAPVVIGS